MEIIERIVDLTTSSVNDIERPAEIAEINDYQKALEKAELEADKLAKRAIILDKLGITEEEAKILLG